MNCGEDTWIGKVTKCIDKVWELLEAEQNLRVSEKRLRLSQAAAGLGHWDFEHKQTEARLAEREAQLALIVEHAPAVIAIFDDKMRYLATSRRYVSDFRLPPDIELIGRSHYEIFPDIPPRWREVHSRVLGGVGMAHAEEPFPRHHGAIDWCPWFMK